MKLLNQTSFISRALRDVDLPTRLNLHLTELIQLAAGETGLLAYDRVALSRPFRELVGVTRALAAFDAATLPDTAARKAFWLNLYATLTLHAVIETRVRKGVREASGFYEQFGYVIGGHALSLDDIEHGILRANRPKYGARKPHWPADDARLGLTLSVLDPRVHFGFYAATRSSPPLQVFSAMGVDPELDQASRKELQRHLSVDWGRGRLSLPKLFKWYERDFGGREGVLRFLATHHPEPRLRELIERTPGLDYSDYDWALNGPNITAPLPPF